MLCIFIPWMLLFNFVGNLWLREVDDTESDRCLYDDGFEMLSLLYLIFNYMKSIGFLLMSCRIYSSMVRYFRRTSHRIPNIAIWRNKTCLDWQEGFDFAIFLFRIGRYSYIQERRYLTAALTRKHNATLIDKIETETYSSDLEYNSTDPSSNNQSKEPLLNEETDALNQSSLSSSSRRNSFIKYKECTICLIEFKDGDKVKIIPGCDHLFHKLCLDNWLLHNFKCPNCNLQIDVHESQADQTMYRR